MEKQYSTQFFSLLLETIQELCRTKLEFHRFAEVTGYISVELDNMKKERYVVNEILQSSGHLVSESFCTKAFKTQTGNEGSLNPSHQSQSKDYFGRNKTDVRIRGHSGPSFKSQNRGHERTRISFQNANIEDSTSQIQSRQSGNQNAYRNTSVYESGENNSCRRSRSQTKVTDQECNSDGNVNVIELDVDDDADSSVESSGLYENKTVQMYKSHNQYQDPVSDIHHDKHNRSIPSQLVQDTYSPSFNTSHCFGQPRSSTQKHQLEHSSQSKESQRLPSEPDVKKQGALNEVDIKPKVEPMVGTSSFLDDDEVIDLDMFEDDLDDASAMDDQFSQDVSSETGLLESSPQMIKTSSHNPNIRNVVKYAVNQFRKYNFLKSEEDIDLFTVAPERLDILLCDFFKGVRKADGSEMNIRTLKNIQSHIDRYLREGGYPYSLVKDHKFHMSRDWIKRKLVEGGKVRRNPTKHTPLSDNEVDILFQSQQLGLHSPDALLNTMWFLNTKYFGIRSLSEHFNLRWGDVVLEQDGKGQEYLVSPLKTIQQYSPKAFPNLENPSRCFVTCYKEYAALRPEGGLDADSYFYLCPQKNSQVCYQESTWYTLEQLSWNRLSFLWKKMVASAGLPPDRKVRSNWNV